MSTGTRIALLSLAAALALGWLGDQLIFFAPRLGLGGALWVGTLVAAVLGVSQWTRLPLTGDGRWLLAGAGLFAAGLTWRGSDVLQFLDLLAIGLCLGLAALTARAGSLSRAGVLSYPISLMLSGLHHIAGPFSLLFQDVNWKEVPQGRWSDRAAAVGRGLVIAVPLLLLFGLLFIAADAGFERLVNDLVGIDMPRLFGHLVGTLFFSFLAAGFLRTTLLRQPSALLQIPRPVSFALGPIENGVILGLLNLLFGAFVLVQLPYLFGGAELVRATMEMTYAEYARRGFFELAMVAALVLPVLLALHWAVPSERAGEQRLFRYLGGSLVAMLFVIMASALQRMYLYTQEYGLTELRLYTTAFMGWMALLFAWFLLTVLRGQRERFALGALVSGLAVLLALHALNPDALIMRTNLAGMERTERFDLEYATHLGPDGVPALVEALPTLPEEQRNLIVNQLQERHQDLSGWGWRSWNWGRSRALQSISSLSPAKP